jgi:hypothetical protein
MASSETGLRIGNGTGFSLPLPLALFFLSLLIGGLVWGVRLEGRINTLEALQAAERTERQLTSVDLQSLQQRVSKLEGRTDDLRRDR